ncbi:hypothetical protein [Streptomyces sp. 8N706]
MTAREECSLLAADRKGYERAQLLCCLAVQGQVHVLLDAVPGTTPDIRG